MSSKNDQLHIQRGEAAAYRKLQEDARLCIEDLRAELAEVSDAELRHRLMRKVLNLEDAFDNDDWLTMKDEDLAKVVKVAVLGSPHAGQPELISCFLTDMNRLTGEKLSGPVGRRTKAHIPCDGKDRILLLHTSVGDPGPQVLAWADAFVVVFNSADTASIEAVETVHRKVVRYRRRSDLPYVGVSIVGSDTSQPTLTLEESKQVLGPLATEMRLVDANPATGKGVNNLFNDIVHDIVKLPGSNGSASGQSTIMEGTLIKHHIHGGSAERWVTLVEDKIVYYHSLADCKSNKGGKSIKLVNVNVKLPMGVSGKRRNKDDIPYFAIQCQDLKTGKLLSWKFETRDMEEAKAWQDRIQMEIQNGISRLSSRGVKNNAAAVSDSKRFTTLSSAQRTQIFGIDGNEVCADCGDSKPEWASLNLTVLVCNDCCGVHRNMGVHISRMRSLELDDWKSIQYDIVCTFGNRIANGIYEANIPLGRNKPSPTTPRAEKERWIRDKYEHMKFLPSKLPANVHQDLFEAISKNEDAATKLKALVQSCFKKSINSGQGNALSRTPLHAAALMGDTLLVQLLLWAGADPSIEDADMKIPVQYSKQAKGDDFVDCVDLLSVSDSRPSSVPVAVSPSAVEQVLDDVDGPDVENNPIRPRTSTLWEPPKKPDRPARDLTSGVSKVVTFAITNEAESEVEAESEADGFVMIGGAVEDSTTTDETPQGSQEVAATEEARSAKLSQAEAARRAQTEAEAAKRTQAETETTKLAKVAAETAREEQAEAEAAKRALPEVEAARRAQAEADAAKQAQAEAEAAKRAQVEAEAAKRAQVEAETAKRAQAEAEAARRAQAEAEAAKRAQAEAEAARQAQAEADAVRQAHVEAEAARRAQAESEAAKLTQMDGQKTDSTHTEAVAKPSSSAAAGREYSITSEADIKTQLKVLLRKDKVKLWEPPYTGPGNTDLITEALVQPFVNQIDADPGLVLSVLSKIRASAVQRKLKKDAAAAAAGK